MQQVKREAWTKQDSWMWVGLLVGMFLLLVACCNLQAQQQPGTPSPYLSDSGINFPLYGAPQPVASATVVRTAGNPGMNTLNYWIVANSLAGQGPMAGPFQISQAPIPGSGNAITLNWAPVAGAVSYDILRTLEANPPQRTGNYAVATGLNATTFVDTVATRTSYTVSPLAVAGLLIRLQNIATGPNTSCLAVNGTCIGGIILTTTGFSGAATLSGNILNIPNYSGVLSINGVAGAFTFSGAGVSCSSGACTFSGGGSGVVGTGTTGQYCKYASNGTACSGETLQASDIPPLQYIPAYTSSSVATACLAYASTASAGCTVTVNGMIYQWVTGTAISGTAANNTSARSQTCTWPVPFSTVYSASVSTGMATATTASNGMFKAVGAPTTAGQSVMLVVLGSFTDDGTLMTPTCTGIGK